MENSYDVFIIGSGPGGEGAAMTCAKEGLKVAICDDFSLVGGSNTHRGTIPSKALRHASQILLDTDQSDSITYQMLIERTKKVIESQVKLRYGFYTRNLVDIIIGRASFIDKDTIELTDPNGLKKNIMRKLFL